jgi:DNA-binding FadR family transcriptional regulator
VIELARGPGSLTMPTSEDGPTSPTSKTQTLIDYLQRQIDTGVLLPGDRLPSARQLRAEHDVSITVVREAINNLKARGYVTGVPGVAVFVAARPPPGT